METIHIFRKATDAIGLCGAAITDKKPLLSLKFWRIILVFDQIINRKSTKEYLCKSCEILATLEEN